MKGFFVHTRLIKSHRCDPLFSATHRPSLSSCLIRGTFAEKYQSKDTSYVSTKKKEKSCDIHTIGFTLKTTYFSDAF